MMKPIWLAGLLGLTVFGAMPALAQQTTTPANADEIQQLKAEVAALQARLDALESKAAPSSPATVPGPSQAIAAPSGWFANTTIGGKIYINVSNIDQQSDGVDSAQNGLQTDVKRLYLTIDHRFSDMFSASVATDFRYNANGTSKDTSVYVKKAYFQAKLAPQFYIRVGSADLPWVPFVENIYGYRFVENTLIDRTKYGTSADWGVHVGGTFGNGLVSYAVSAINGAGYKTLSRSSDTIDLEGRISVEPVRHLVLAVGGYTGKLGKSSAAAPDTTHRATRFDALAAYTGPRIRAGIEYFSARDWNNITTVAEDRSSGWSAFGSFAVTPRIALFGRYDWVNPNQDSNPALSEHYVNAGVDFQPLKAVDLALVYKRDRAENGLVPTSNGTIGGTKRGTYDEIGIWSQIKF